MTACALPDLKVLETGFWKQANSGSGCEVRVEPTKRSCVAGGTQEWVKHI